MPFGFLAPDGRYWQTDDHPPEALRAAYPAGTVEVPLRPGPDHAWIGEEWVYQELDPVPLPPDFEATVLQLYDEMDQTHGVDLEAAVSGRGPKALTRFRIANTIKRSDPMVATLQTGLGWTNAQVDALFIAAAAR